MLVRACVRAYDRAFVRQEIVPTINLLGVNFAWLIGGTVVIETVFSIPGLGSLMVSSIFARDYLVVQCVTIFFAVLVTTKASKSWAEKICLKLF